MKYKKINELKDISREKMLGKYGTAIGAFLFMRGLMWFVTDLSRAVANPDGLIFAAILFIIALIEGVFIFGEQKIYLKIARYQETRMNDMFSVFKADADRAILARFIMMFMTYAPIVVAAYAIRYGITYKATMIPAIGIAVLMGVISVTLYLNYSQAVLLLLDNTSLGVMAAYKESRRLMKGRKLALLWVIVSFVPLHIIGVISFMAGEVFIHPYYKLTLTEFYLELVDEPAQIKASGSAFDVAV